MKDWKRNIFYIQVIRICFSLLFSVSVISLFWKSMGLTIEDIFRLQGIFSLSMVLFEVPTGFIGDRLGRKKTMILAALLTGSGWFLYSLARGFWSFVFCEIVLGIGFSFLSGTDSAFLFETLKSLKKEKDFTALEGKQLGRRHWGEGLSALLGGVLSVWIPFRGLLLLSGGAMILAFCAALRLKDPPREAYIHPRGRLYTIYKIGRFVFLKSKMVRYALPLLAMCSLSTMLGVWFYQSFWESLDYPLWTFGLLWAAMSLPASVASHWAAKIEKKLGPRGSLLILPLPVLLGYLGLAFVPGKAAGFFVYANTLLWGYCMPLLSRYINEETYDDKRATVLSLMSWLFRFSYAITAPFVGKIGKDMGLRTGFLVCGGISLVLISLFIPPLIKAVERSTYKDNLTAGERKSPDRR